VGGRSCCSDEGIGKPQPDGSQTQDGGAVVGSGNGGWLGSGGMKKSGATGAVLFGVLGGWFFELHPPRSRQCFLQSWRLQSGAMRDCPQPSTSHFPWAMVARDWVAGTKAVAVVAPPRCREGVVEKGEMLGDFDEPSDGVAVFAQGVRTVALLRKMVRRPDNKQMNRG